MKYKIIGDSCLDLPVSLRKDPHFQIVPLTLQIDETQVVDDETFDQQNFLRLIKASPNCPKTACPSPESFMNAYHCEAEWIFVVTLSKHLSGSNNSAMLAKQLYAETYGDKKIAVIDSLSASSGQVNIALKIQELCQQELTFEEVVERAEAARDQMQTLFVLETLDILRKNGRLTGLQAFFATTLNIKPIMGAEKGVIVKLNQSRGIQIALNKMCDLAIKDLGDPTDKRAVIAHCNCPDRAAAVKAELQKRAAFKDIMITDTAGVATVYAADGGIILAIL